ncbi:MAG: CinA family nicotinamide mononucleotide deamidase-related protein [Desulfobacula sp.]|uniref:CinA family nicotinamide mononucleotide deamidase-related protein n=1 Tax=Desulfobacula sp. TaxID=2593537 RepID=UPI0025C314F0|nr:CinA family nicotinamide mononucleotide deamidase-related protein [Desulfobacula sp.]MCD4722653.1 CinA family nicotinamide mononucleotide deamidase-related protein [Desulfobacula sp.]
MIAHILSTGDEVLLGDIVDTNSAFLCRALKEMGIEVQKIIAVGDDVDAIASIIGDISLQADICLVTGGLGPTRDDLTGLACSKASGNRLELNIDALESMRSYFKKRGFQLTRDNEKQALLPSSSNMLINRNGTAPGFYIKINQCLFFFMPGVPSEMKMMFEKEIKKVLVNKFNLFDDILIERLTVFGLPESKVGALLKGFETKFFGIRLGFRADFPVIEVKIILSGSFKEKDKARADIAKAKQWVVLQLENKVVSEQGLTIAQEVGGLLTKQGKTLAIAESCTGGLISNMVTDVAGSSNYFLFSGITYSNDAKINILNVRKETIIEYGAVHEQTALEMAQGARHKAHADFAISTTGIAGPGGGTKEKPVGMVCIGIAGSEFSMARTYRFSFDDRVKNKKIFAMMALEILRRHLVLMAKTF